jgi:predicted GNAT family N-acyltransferase
LNWRVDVFEWDALPAAARAIREAVFVCEQQVPIELEWDEFDARSLHALALGDGDQPVGTGRLLPDGRIGRMAVLPPWRGRGVGAAILSALIAHAARLEMPRVLLHAQTHAAGFYARGGFLTVGGEFLEAGIPHVTMVRDLPPGLFVD